MNTTLLFAAGFLVAFCIGMIIFVLIKCSKSFDGILVITKGPDKDNYFLDVQTPFEEMEEKDYIKLKIVIKTDSI